MTASVTVVSVSRRNIPFVYIFDALHSARPDRTATR